MRNNEMTRIKSLLLKRSDILFRYNKNINYYIMV